MESQSINSIRLTSNYQEIKNIKTIIRLYSFMGFKGGSLFIRNTNCFGEEKILVFPISYYISPTQFNNNVLDLHINILSFDKIEFALSKDIEESFEMFYDTWIEFNEIETKNETEK